MTNVVVDKGANGLGAVGQVGRRGIEAKSMVLEFQLGPGVEDVGIGDKEVAFIALGAKYGDLHCALEGEERDIRIEIEIEDFVRSD